MRDFLSLIKKRAFWHKSAGLFLDTIGGDG
jgi:hypothetical protein